MHASTYQTEATTTEPPTITLSSSALHWNVPCVVAQLTLERDVILSSNNPMSVLRHLPALRTSEIIQEAQNIMEMLPRTFIDDLRGHLWDMRVVRRLLASASHSVPSTMEYDEMAWFQDATLATLGEADNIARFSLNGQAKLEGHIQADAAHACESYDDGFEWEDD